MLVFLDIDGVMVPAKSWKNPELLDDGFPSFSPKAVRVLQNLLTDDTRVILTSSHKSRFSLKEWKNKFETRGLKVEKISSLEDNATHQSRKDEILNWFNLNRVNEEFIIIDDDKSLNDLPSYLKDKLVLTSPMIGLTDSHMDEIKSILGNQNLQVAK